MIAMVEMSSGSRFPFDPMLTLGWLGAVRHSSKKGTDLSPENGVNGGEIERRAQQLGVPERTSGTLAANLAPVWKRQRSVIMYGPHGPTDTRMTCARATPNKRKSRMHTM